MRTTRLRAVTKGKPSDVSASPTRKPAKPLKNYAPPDSATEAAQEPDESAGLTPIEYKRWLLDETMRAYRRAVTDHSHVACRQLLRDAGTLRADIEATVAADVASAAALDRLGDGEWSEALRERAIALADDDLEVFVAEYLRRNKHVHLVPA